MLAEEEACVAAVAEELKEALPGFNEMAYQTARFSATRLDQSDGAR
jgi:hypothetical protein